MVNYFNCYKYVIDFKNQILYLTVMIFTVLSMKYSSWFSDMFCEEIQTFAVIQHLPPPSLRELIIKRISETMDLNEKKKINIGRRL